jgi:hypothetical protein
MSEEQPEFQPCAGCGDLTRHRLAQTSVPLCATCRDPESRERQISARHYQLGWNAGYAYGLHNR